MSACFNPACISPFENIVPFDFNTEIVPAGSFTRINWYLNLVFIGRNQHFDLSGLEGIIYDLKVE
jgi:hypothetical protein